MEYDLLFVCDRVSCITHCRYRPGAEDVAAGDVVVLHHLGLGEDLGVPVGQVLLLLGLDTQPRLAGLGGLGFGLSNKIK